MLILYVLISLRCSDNLLSKVQATFPILYIIYTLEYVIVVSFGIWTTDFQSIYSYG
jgi:hypothetical protein